MNPKARKLLENTIYPDLENGRPNWDLHHTKAVVRYMESILETHPELALDPEVMIPAAMAHDWGYAGLFRKGQPVSLAQNKDKKAEHMVLGAQKIEELLNNETFDYLTNRQKERIVHLVSVHDKLTELKDTDELVLMEADTLGATDINGLKPTHSYQEYLQWLDNTTANRITRFRTNYSKQKIKQLLLERARHYKQIPRKLP